MSGLFVFDFDGVVCDSARETGISAWKAGRKLWKEWAEEHPPAAALQRFCQLRPFLETGYQAVGMMRMAMDHPALPRELTVDDVVEWIESFYAEQGMTREDMVTLFGQTRDEWITADPAGWLGEHRFFPGVVDLLTRLRARGDVVILSTKQERFIHQLLAGAGLDFSSESVFGLERQAPKKVTLAQFVKDRGDDAAPVCFVEDRLETLEDVMGVPDLAGVKLFLVDWGYSTDEQRRRAADTDRIHWLRAAESADWVSDLTAAGSLEGR
ncbi:MAG: HAD family hydrolase [Lentisphaeria bacterium]|nr:HAD family hydrolase [Lentisphaeria bacterium]